MTTATEPRTLSVGDVLYSSWGYDQTNVDFYKVTRCTTKTAWIVRIGSRQVEGSDGFMSCRVVPDPSVHLCERCHGGPDAWFHQPDASPERYHAYLPAVSMHRIRISSWDNLPRLTLNSYSSASLWDKDERGTYCSWYA